ncbi:MAG: HNH endonuclease signature motif containing protein [Cyanobium sp. CZS 48M]|nr:HNH endonuclease signature motif containing protein [Cyanobium sp. CZS48M]
MPSYWWVNHKQTYRKETDGGYIWSPKANANGARNVTYDNLSRCQRGDVVFSYANGRISQLGLVIEEHADPAVRVHLVVLAEEGEYTAALLDDMQWLREVPSSTERDALTKARLGQGLFRHRVSELEPACRVTGLARQEFLVASHIKPWRSCDNSERLSGANGLLLSPHVDKLFDRHWISFDGGGQLICEHEAAREALRCWGIEGANLIRPFSREQEKFLSAHREALRC